MSNESAALVRKLWNYCTLLRHDGVSYLEYVEQLTYLLFLKMADERQQSPYSKNSAIPEEFSWRRLLPLEGEALEVQYDATLKALAKEPGLLGLIFRKAQNRVRSPANLHRLVADLIDGANWTSLDIDVKGDAYEGLLAKGAEDTKTGAGQYFTPRPLIRTIVEVMRPSPDMTICDPACGTGGFLLAAHDHIAQNNLLDRTQQRHLKFGALRGWELVDTTARLCAMNFFLHGVGGDEEVIRVADSLAADPGDRFDMVLTNPPFGKKSGLSIVGEDGDVERESTIVVRDDFWASSANKQLNFIQHVKTLLKINGRAAVIVPDNVLFEGGAGEVVRRKLLHECDLHTLLRLPTGIFYKPGVKANVMFFDRRAGSERAATERLWIYDFRTNQHFKLKTNPLRRENLDEFVAAYNPANRHDRFETELFKAFGYDELVKRDKASLDIFWLRDDTLDDSDNLPAPDLIAAEIVDDLQAALDQFLAIAADLAAKDGANLDDGPRDEPLVVAQDAEAANLT